MALNLRFLNSMVKVFEDEEPFSPPECNVITALRGESVFFQVALLSDKTQKVTVKGESDFGNDLILKSVEYVPVNYSSLDRTIMSMNRAEGYEVCENPGPHPDILRSLKDGVFKIRKNKYHAIWCEVKVTENVAAGVYPIRLTFTESDGSTAEITHSITVLDATLPPQEILHAEWFYADCLADFYKTKAFSEKHWKICENFIRCAVSRGINVIYTCQFTPPLDTAVGGERTTAQLIDVYCEKGKWRFGFDKLKRWIDLCFACGANKVEMSHLFTQWGAKAAPKIMAWVDGKYTRVFGWDTPVADGRYPAFLAEYLPQLTAKLKEWGVVDRCIMHISDEPSVENQESYNLAKKTVEPYLTDFYCCDATSHIEIYEQGICKHPVVVLDRLPAFLEAKVPDLWGYYCCFPRCTTNRFHFFKLAKVRALGVPLYRYDLKGFLHWGFCFYNTVWSLKHVDPYKGPVPVHAEGIPTPTFPSGDSFVVYPGRGGMPEESPRLIMLYEALCDQRTLAYLGSLIGREAAMKIAEDLFGSEITFKNFPQTEYYYVLLRNRLNEEIVRALHK